MFPALRWAGVALAGFMDFKSGKDRRGKERQEDKDSLEGKQRWSRAGKGHQEHLWQKGRISCTSSGAGLQQQPLSLPNRSGRAGYGKSDMLSSEQVQN